MTSGLSRIIYSFTLCILLCQVLPAQEDLTKLREIIALKPSIEKIGKLNDFVVNNPSTQYLYRANLELFYTYLDLDNIDSALVYAYRYTESPGVNKANAYNSVSYTLAENDKGLDTALAYANKAVELLRGNRNLKMVQDTKAYVLYKRKEFKAALELQKEAIVGNETDPEYLFHLALYQEAAGNFEDALKSAGLAALYDYPTTAMSKFNEWSTKINKSEKEKLVMDIAGIYIDSSENEDKTLLRSNAAAFMAQVGVNLEKANEWAETAVKTIDQKTNVENYVIFKKNIAIVKTSEKKYKEALKDLEEVRELASPWSGDYWITLGNVYENLGQKDKAFDAYISGIVAVEIPRLMEAAGKIASKEEITAAIDKKKSEMENVHIGEYKEPENTTGKVVLAELFTGAECGPCVAADNAFDELSEYYPRNALAILEYHVHIPGPDPLTNPESFQRYSWYGGDFGTPTVFFEGTEQIVGGGPKMVTSNRFNVYNYTIKKYLEEEPAVSISGDAKLNGNNIDINISVKPNEVEKSVKPVLHIALTEKSVDYTGANGVSKHIFVVRDLVDGPEGTILTVDKETSFIKNVDMAKLEEVINNYLTDPTKDPSWRAPQFNGWRLEINKLNNVNEKNLAVVAWVQDSETKEILQAHYFDVN